MPRKKEEVFEEEINNVEEADENLEAPEEQAEAPSEAAEESPADEVEDVREEDVPEIDSVAVESRRMTADVPLQLVAVLGKKTLSMKELLSLKMGQVLDLARPVNEQVDLVAGGKLFARGELVDIDGKLGVRIIKMVR